MKGYVGDVINTGGYKVSSVEVENAAMSQPAVADCICTSESHPMLGQALKLIYTVKAEATLSLPTLVAHLRQSLAPHEIPLAYEQADKIARTFNGKLDRMYYRKQQPQ